MNKEELIELFDQFVNEMGCWYQFKDFVEEKGYTVEELGFAEE